MTVARAVSVVFLAACIAGSACIALEALAESPLGTPAVPAAATRKVAAAAEQAAPLVPDGTREDREGTAREGESLEAAAATQRIRYRVHGGDTWERIARRHGTTPSQLRRWNPETSRTLGIGDELSVHVPAGFEPLPETGLGLDRDPQGLQLLPIPDHGESRGRPSRGRLRNGVRMPDNPSLYLVRRPEFAYGSSHTVRNLQLAIAKFRETSRCTGPVVLSAVSRRRACGR